MKAIIFTHVDRSQRIGPVVPIDFDTDKWVRDRLESLALLGVVSVKEMELSPIEA